jgi:hypothetical protein
MKILTLFMLVISTVSMANSTGPDKNYYRKLTMDIRREASFRIPMPDGKDMNYSYKIELGEPIYAEPMVSDTSADTKGKFFRSFYDRIWLKDGSIAKLGGEEIPLTCIFVSGQDNRYSGNDSPLFPQFIMKIIVVANDYTCSGPIRPGWPAGGGRKENWGTYIHYEVRDPTIMLPVENGLRYRWNEYTSILVR